MNTIDAITLGISIGLSILSIVLGFFAIWLSYKFSENSAKALDAVKDLSKETRTLVELNLEQQKSFSGKMLDSILEQNKFGTTNDDISNSSNTVNDVITNTLKDIEEKINVSVERELREFGKKSSQSNAELQQVVNAIKSDIGTISEAAPTISSELTLPTSTKNALKYYLDFPAHYVVLAAIVKNNANSFGDVSEVAEEFALPGSWESGINNLIDRDILEETETGFKVPDKLLNPIKTWVDKNKEHINELMVSYRNRDAESSVSDHEKLIAKSFKF